MFLGRANFDMRFHPLLFLLLLFCRALSGAEPVREMSTDRPDTTESAYSVPAGMFQVEMSFFDYSRDGDRGSRIEDWILGQMNFKVGVGENADLQFLFDTYTQSRTNESGLGEKLSGFGDMTIRFKQNIWGNDSGTTAFALMPYVTIPTQTELSGDAWAGGLIMPLGISLSDRVSLGLMAEVDVVPDADTDGYDLEWLHSATLGFSLTQKLGMYLEVVGIAGQDTKFQALFDAGLTFAVTDTLIFDVGMRLGMNRAAADIGVFTGVSARF